MAVCVVSISNLAEAFAFMFTETVKIKPYLGPTGAGGRLYGPEKVYHCRIQEDAKPIFTATGQQVVSTSTLFVHPRAVDGTLLAALSVDSSITLPDLTSPRLLRAGMVNDFDGSPIYWRLLT